MLYQHFTLPAMKSITLQERIRLGTKWLLNGVFVFYFFLSFFSFFLFLKSETTISLSWSRNIKKDEKSLKADKNILVRKANLSAHIRMIRATLVIIHKSPNKETNCSFSCSFHHYLWFPFFFLTTMESIFPLDFCYSRQHTPLLTALKCQNCSVMPCITWKLVYSSFFSFSFCLTFFHHKIVQNQCSKPFPTCSR